MKTHTSVKAGFLNDNVIGVSLISVKACDSGNFTDSLHIL